MAPLRGMGAQIPVPLFIFPERSSHMAEKQLTTIEQLRALAERGKQDTLIRINELLDSMIPLLESAQHAGITVTLPAEKWSGRAQTVQDESLLADGKYWYIVCADADCFMAASETGVKADNITTDGQVTFRCEVTPTENLTISILRLEVEQSNE